MFQNYSQTYAAAITTYAPLIVLVLGHFGVTVLESDVVLISSLIISTIGIIWQTTHRYTEGGVTKLGFKN